MSARGVSACDRTRLNENNLDRNRTAPMAITVKLAPITSTLMGIGLSRELVRSQMTAEPTMAAPAMTLPTITRRASAIDANSHTCP